MGQLFVFNTDENLLAILENKDGSNACPHYETTVIEQLNGEFTLEFQIPAGHRDAQHVIRGNKIGLWDPDQNFLLFDISKTDDDHGESLVKTVTCEHSMIVELNDDIVRDKRPVDVTADVALDGILTDTVLGGVRWKRGTVASLGTATPDNVFYETVMSGIQKVRLGYKTDYKPRITVANGKIGDRFIDLGPRGSDTGRRFEYTKDLKQIKREVDMTGVKTALIGRGKGEETGDGYGRRIDFGGVIWSTANGDPTDKPDGQIYVGDPEALAQFGLADGLGGKRHRLGNFEDADETDPAVLISKTWDHLQTINQPRVSYSMTVIDLAELTGLDHQKVRLGDTVTVIDREFVPAITIKARVIEVKRVVGEPDKTEIKLGNFIPLMTDESLKIEEIERTINDRSGIWESGGGPVTNDDFENITPTAPANVSAVGLFKTIMVDWYLETDVSIGQYEVYASTVAGFTPDTTNGSNLVYRGYSGGYAHDAQTNEQWYFRIRAVNKHGVGGPFSLEVSATTIQVGAGDIIPKVITNELIADNANIDFAKLANVKITNAHIDNATIDWAKLTNIAVTNAHIAERLTATNITVGPSSVFESGYDIADYANIGTITDNSVFAKWAGTYPDGFVAWGDATTISKNTGSSRVGGHAVRFEVGLDQDGGIRVSHEAVHGLAEYIYIEFDVMATFGANFKGAGVIMDWVGSTTYTRQNIDLHAEVPAPELNKWYKIKKVVKKPSTNIGAFSNYLNYLMGNWSGFNGVRTAKTIYYDSLIVRPATRQEIETIIKTTRIDENGIYTGEILVEQIGSGSGVVANGNVASGKTVTSFDGTNTTSAGTAVDGSKNIGSSYVSFGSGNSSNNGGEIGYVQIDLGSIHRIAESRAFLYSGDDRYYWYKIKYSIDGVNWKYAIGHEANDGWVTSIPRNLSGNYTQNPTINTFSIPISARYLRLYGNGSTSNTGNHIYEWEVYTTSQTKIHGGNIETGTITADRLNVSTLSAITANLGTVTAGTITGINITGGSITSNTTINVGTTLKVGDAIYVGTSANYGSAYPRTLYFGPGNSYSPYITGYTGSRHSLWVSAYDMDWSIETLTLQQTAEFVVKSESGAGRWRFDDSSRMTVRSIYGQHNSTEIIRDHANGNVTFSSQGGQLYLGYLNTSSIRSERDHIFYGDIKMSGGPYIHDASGHLYLQRDTSNYIGIYSGSMSFWFGGVSATLRDDGHTDFVMRSALIKGVNDNTDPRMQIRRYDDAQWGAIQVLRVDTYSSKKGKKNIKPFDEDTDESALDKVMKTKVYKYHYNQFDDKSKKHTGILYEEAPDEIKSENMEGINVTDTLFLLMKAVQELKDELDQYKKKGAK
jgi:phage minor structural protein